MVLVSTKTPRVIIVTHEKAKSSDKTAQNHFVKFASNTYLATAEIDC